MVNLDGTSGFCGRRYADIRYPHPLVHFVCCEIRNPLTMHSFDWRHWIVPECLQIDEAFIKVWIFGFRELSRGQSHAIYLLLTTGPRERSDFPYVRLGVW